MAKRLFVGNLAYTTTEDDLQQAFAPFGVTDVQLPVDRFSGRPRGFGFVTVSDDQADAAVAHWNGKELQNRALTVNEARPREEGGGGRGFGGGGGYGGGGGGGGFGGGSYDGGGGGDDRRGGGGRGGRDRGDRRDRW